MGYRLTDEKSHYVTWVLSFRTQSWKEHAAIRMQSVLEKRGTEVIWGAQGGR